MGNQTRACQEDTEIKILNVLMSRRRCFSLARSTSAWWMSGARGQSGGSGSTASRTWAPSSSSPPSPSTTSASWRTAPSTGSVIKSKSLNLLESVWKSKWYVKHFRRMNIRDFISYSWAPVIATKKSGLIFKLIYSWDTKRNVYTKLEWSSLTLKPENIISTNCKNCRTNKLSVLGNWEHSRDFTRFRINIC